MSKKKETSTGIENVEQTLTKTEQFLEENYKPLLYGLIAVVAVVGIFWLLENVYHKTEQGSSEPDVHGRAIFRTGFAQAGTIR
ncbi:MAG: hypothetical protein MZV63_03990 [Marinilabiliales bacterium]|nr:hypothetical protein [Marinilabiliales bacterium]